MGRPPCSPTQAPQKIVEQPKDHAHERRKKKLLPLKCQRQLHLSKQPLEQSTALLRFLITQRADGAGDSDLTAVNGQSFQMKIFAPND